MKLACPKCGNAVETQESTVTCPACGATFAAGDIKTSFESAPPADPNIGQTIGGCKLLERVGAGGMGIVYKAEQISLGRIVALKILPEAMRQDAQIRERFQREIAILASLNHPNIVAILDGGISDQGAFFIMEYVDGVSLRRILSSGGVKPGEALRIIPQLCDALEYAHGKGVVHRDIKPENILIDRAGRVRLLDFGLSRIAKTDEPGLLTRPTQVLGTFEYMAPEQREASRSVDHRADLYSLGVVLYEMLTGELPIGRFDLPSQRNLHIDVRLDEVVLHALEKSPDRRYQRASDIKTEVERISTSQPPAERSAPAAGSFAAPVGGARASAIGGPPRPSAFATPPPTQQNAGAGGAPTQQYGGAAADAAEPPRDFVSLGPVLTWAGFGAVVIVGVASREWFSAMACVAGLFYAFKKIGRAPNAWNQRIVWCSLVVMSIVAFSSDWQHVRTPIRYDSDFPFVKSASWLTALALMFALVYLTGRFPKHFANPARWPYWSLLGLFGIAAVGSGQMIAGILFGGLLVFIDHLIERHEARGDTPEHHSFREAHNSSRGSGFGDSQTQDSGAAPPIMTPPPIAGAPSHFEAPQPPPPPPIVPAPPSSEAPPIATPPPFAPPPPPIAPPSSAFAQAAALSAEPGSVALAPIPVSKLAIAAVWFTVIGTVIVGIAVATLLLND